MCEGAILITGGTGTLGGALTRSLCAQGHRVIANFAHDGERARRLQAETGCELWRADIGDEAAVCALFEVAPPLLAVVHVAGITRDALLLRQSAQSWQDVMNVNLNGAFLVAREALQRLEEGGRLIFVVSRVGERGAAGQGAYAAGKAATIGLMKCAAREGTERNLKVNAICPPFVPSALSANLKQEKIATLMAQSVQAHAGDVQSFVGAVQWLLSEAGSGVSGQVIHCDDRVTG